MDQPVKFAFGLLVLILGLVFLGWILIAWLRRSEDSPTFLIFKWILSACLIVFVMFPVAASLVRGGTVGIFSPVIAAAVGGILAILWVPNITGWFGRRVESLFTGGDDPPEQKPFYSVANAYRKRGDYDRCQAEIHKQLQRFPGDTQGYLMLAEIQAQDLNDLEAARETIETFCEEAQEDAQKIGLALTAMADWYVAINQDVDAARACLEQIAERVPNTPQASQALQRLGHIGTRESHAARLDRKPIRVKPGVKNIGLMDNSAELRPKEEDPEEIVAGLINQLEDYPHDTEAREKLAVLYADHYRDLDLAQEQLEWLLSLPNQRPRQTVQWINLLADLQVRLGADEEQIRQTIQRIIDLNPESGHAEQARHRLDHLPLELKGREKGGSVSMD